MELQYNLIKEIDHKHLSNNGWDQTETREEINTIVFSR